MVKELRFILRENVRHFRTKNKLTQEQLSGISGIGYKYLQLIESKNPPNLSLKVIERLAKALKVPPSKLLSP